MAKNETEILFVNPFGDEIASIIPDDSKRLVEVAGEIEDAAKHVAAILTENGLPTEEEAAERAVFEISRAYTSDLKKSYTSDESDAQLERDMIISFRAAFQGFVLSLIDSSPSEICVITLKNVNALASWNMLRTSASTIYFTVTSMQVDNMLPNAPYPVAICPMPHGTGTASSSTDEIVSSQDGNNPPVMVIGVSLAPRHQSGTVVSVHFVFCCYLCTNSESQIIFFYYSVFGQ